MRILLDCDGCILDMLGAIKKRDRLFKPEGVVDYNMRVETYGIKRSKVMSYLSDIHTFKLQELYDNAEKGIEMLNKLGILYAYTSVPRHVVYLRRGQLYKLGIDRQYVFTEAKPYMQCDAIIDDCPDVLKLYENTETICIIIDRPYNRGYQKAKRVTNLIEAARYLQELRKSS